jgi:hypothetical protein
MKLLALKLASSPPPVRVAVQGTGPISIREDRKTETTNKPNEHSMKSKIHIISLTALVVILTGCAGPEARHDNRVDRRHDTAERVEDRSTNRQDNRYDRRDDRYDRRDARYGY